MHYEYDNPPEQPSASASDPPEAAPPTDLQPLVQAFRAQLVACLEECATGRTGLFTDTQESCPWPEAARLRELAFALQAILTQSGDSDLLCEHFLDLCTIHGENDPGERRLAREFLGYIGAQDL